jgi:hypothetical protein
MNKFLRMTLAALVVAGLAAGAALAGDSLRLRAKLRAPAAFGDISGHAKYRARDDGRNRFTVEVEGMSPGDRFQVVVDDVVVGFVTIDSLGIGELEFDTSLEAGDTEGPFPASFPRLDGGELVEIGPLSGTLQRRK